MLQGKPGSFGCCFGSIRAVHSKHFVTVELKAVLHLKKRVCMFGHAELSVNAVLDTCLRIWIWMTQLFEAFVCQHSSISKWACGIIVVNPALSQFIIDTDRRNGIRGFVHGCN